MSFENKTVFWPSGRLRHGVEDNDYTGHRNITYNDNKKKTKKCERNQSKKVLRVSQYERVHDAKQQPNDYYHHSINPFLDETMLERTKCSVYSF